MVDINNKENETLESDFIINSNLTEENKEKEKIQQLEESLRKGSIQFYSVTKCTTFSNNRCPAAFP